MTDPATQTYPLDFVKFGALYDEYVSEYFTYHWEDLIDLGNSKIDNGLINQAVVSTGIQGIGLGSYAYDQIMMLISNLGEPITESTFTCPDAGTYCTFSGSCDSLAT